MATCRYKGGENMDVADSYKRMSGNGREKKTGSLSESAVRFLTRIGLRF